MYTHGLQCIAITIKNHVTHLKQIVQIHRTIILRFCCMLKISHFNIDLERNIWL